MVAPQIIPRRTVAFFDILGFRQTVLTTPLSDLAAKYERWIAETDAMNHPENLVSGTAEFQPLHAAAQFRRNKPREGVMFRFF